ncbi:TetR/AcrR family transcriptional regulator, partial [Streptomyces sp. NPDC000405]|uniref:TetR/AcrR family transcriptional regulator n=1 Tax=Streptomyces sp. NPDC000405 TaxID=3161033 RepID=UPI00398D24CC
MSVTGTQKPVRASSGQKRSAILGAARELFLQHGVDRVNMDTVAAQAGVSKATVYSHFGGHAGDRAQAVRSWERALPSASS